MPAWALTVAFRRLRLGWVLPAVVTVIAVLSCTLLSLLLLLVQNAEQGGVRASLTSLQAADSGIRLDLTRPSVSLAEARQAGDRGVQRAFADAATVASTFAAESDFGAAPTFDNDLSAFGYFSSTDDISTTGTLVSGAWPVSGGSSSTTGELPVAVPERAASAHGMALGSTFAVSTGSTTSVTVRVVATYMPDTSHPFWAADALSGDGDVPGFPKPGVTFYSPIEAIGPLLVTSDALDETTVPVRLLTLSYRPDFARTGTSEVAGLADRLADSDLTTAIGDVAARVTVSTQLPASLAQVTTGLTVTRSTVSIVAVLLTLLSIAAVGQAARLFSASRAEDRVLARARGSSTAQLLGLAGIEAAMIGVIAAGSGPLAAWGLLPVVLPGAAATPGGSPAPALPVWGASAILALVFTAVLLAPFLAPSGAAADAPRQRARQSRTSGIMRSGLDLAVVALAVVLYTQLLHYRSPVRGASTLSLDPILVLGPAAVLLAGALLAARSVPLVARQLERLTRHANGMIGPLSSWEISRRTRAATAVVLLLTLSLAVGTFSQSYLATWRQSQVDQAELAVGAPVVVGADAAASGSQAGRLGAGQPNAGQPALVTPSIRRGARVSVSAGAYDQLPSGPPATVLGLSQSARDLLLRGRLASLGGETIDAALGQNPDRASGIDLPETTRGVSATVTISTVTALAGVVVDVRAMVEDGDGLLTVLDLGTVAPDGAPHTAQALLPGDASSAVFSEPARVVGFQSTIAQPDTGAEAPPTAGTDASITIASLAALTATTDAQAVSTEVLPPTSPAWSALSDVTRSRPPLVDVVPGGVTLHADVPGSLTSRGSTFTLVGWQPAETVPAVVTDTLADTLSARTGTSLGLVVNDTLVRVQLAATSPYAPGASGGDLLTEVGPAATATGPPAAIVVDQVLLSRALAQAGYPGPFVDEWWVDVAAGRGEAYAAAHPSPAGTRPTQSIDGLSAALQNGPLRVASPAALRLAVAAGALLAAIGFALHTSGSLRSRRPELANLRAIGASKRQIVALVAAESALLVGIGIVLGVALGVALSLLVGPLIGVSPNGAPPLPQVVIVLPWVQMAALVAVVAAAIAAFIVPLAALTRSLDPAQILRSGS